MGPEKNNPVRLPQIVFPPYGKSLDDLGKRDLE